MNTKNAVQTDGTSSLDFYTTESEPEANKHKKWQYFNNETNKKNETIACNPGERETEYVYIVYIVYVILGIILIIIGIAKYHRLVRKER